MSDLRIAARQAAQRAAAAVRASASGVTLALAKDSDTALIDADLHPRTDRRITYVYLIQEVSEDGRGMLKIGVSTDPVWRLKQLQTANPRELRLICARPATPLTEKALHERFDGFRIRGEWFSFSETIMRAFVGDDL